MKISNFLFVLSLLIIVSCGDDSGAENEMLIGSWDLAQVNGDGTLITIEDGVSTEGEIAVSSGDVSYVLTFTEGSYVTAGSYNITNESIDENGAKVFEPFIYSNASGSGTYMLVDKSMTTTGPFIGIQVDGVNLGEMTTEQSSTLESLTAEEIIFTNVQERTVTEGEVTKTLMLNLRSVWTKR